MGYETTPQLSYPPLAGPCHIRLLHVLPGLLSCPIRCEFIETNLDDAQISPFIALSYSWGCVDVSHTIFVDGQQKSVSKSVHDALRVIQELPTLETHGRNMWIDAICIDQDKSSEKTAQVRLMARIYSAASTVVAWLGEMTSSDRAAVALINEVVSKLGLDQCVRVGETGANEIYRRDPVLETAAIAERKGLPDVNDQAWYAVVHFFRKPWFSRVWIIQECLLARSFVFLCGHELVSPELLFAFGDSMFTVGWLREAMDMGRRFHPVTKEPIRPSEGRDAYLSVMGLPERQNMSRRDTPTSLMYCMYHTIGFKATDCRDKVFALVSLSADVDASIIDYELSPQELTMQLAFRYLKEGRGGSDILSAAQMFGRLPEVPSWIPCWTEPGNIHPLHLVWGTGSSFKGFGANSINRRVHEPNRGVMGVSSDGSLIIGAQAVDRIVRLPHVEAQEVSWDWYTAPARNLMQFSNPDFADWIVRALSHSCSAIEVEFQQADLIAKLIDRYPNGHRVEECLLRSRVHDDQHKWSTEKFDTYIGAGRAIVRDLIPELLRLAKILGAQESQPGRMERYSIANEINNEMWRVLTEAHDQALLARKDALGSFTQDVNIKRKLAVTANGLIAWVPYSAEVGDAINVMDGTRIPILLRRENGRLESAEVNLPKVGKVEVDAWNVVGDVYLHGFMTGPLEDAMKTMGWKLGDGKRHVELV